MHACIDLPNAVICSGLELLWPPTVEHCYTLQSLVFCSVHLTLKTCEMYSEQEVLIRSVPKAIFTDIICVYYMRARVVKHASCQISFIRCHPGNCEMMIVRLYLLQQICKESNMLIQCSFRADTLVNVLFMSPGVSIRHRGVCRTAVFVMLPREKRANPRPCIISHFLLFAAISRGQPDHNLCQSDMPHGAVKETVSKTTELQIKR